MKIVHLMSGGLDSTVMLYDLLEQGNEVYCVLFNYDQKHIAELKFARATCEKLNIRYSEVELCRIKNLFLRCALTDGESDNVVVPNRNAVFLNIAVAIAESMEYSRVTFGANADDTIFPDCQPKFIRCLNKTIFSAGIPVIVEAPYIEKTKSEIVFVGRKLRVPFNETMSCYNGNNCGKCLACKIRKKALKSCGQ